MGAIWTWNPGFGPKAETPAEQPVIPEPKGVPFLETKERHCRWIIEGEKLDAICCGKRVLPGKSFCGHHYGIAYTPAGREP
jgi:hypothetical protein